MSKPSKNSALIEHVGACTIYFDRDANAFAVDAGGLGTKNYQTLSSARQWALRVGGHGPTLSIPVVLVGRDKDEPVPATLVAHVNGRKRVAHQDGTSEVLPWWKKAIHRKPNTARKVAQLMSALVEADRVHNDARNALDNYLKENALPSSLEELMAISRPVKRARKGR